MHVCITECFTYASWTQNDTMASKSVKAALSVSTAVPRFSCRQVGKMFTTLEIMCFFVGVPLILSRPIFCADLSTADLLADEEVNLLHIFRGVVCAAGRGQSVSPSSPRLLVVTGQGLSQVPMSYKSTKLTRTLASATQNYASIMIFNLQ